jgi:hypothetical protein
VVWKKQVEKLKANRVTGISIRGDNRYFYLPKMVFGTS